MRERFRSRNKLSMKAPAIDKLVRDELMALRSRPRARELADPEACSARDARPVRTLALLSWVSTRLVGRCEGRLE